MRGMHVPASSREAQDARRRFALEELLYIELGVVRRRRMYQEEGSAPQLALPPSVRQGFEISLPVGLTAAQRRGARGGGGGRGARRRGGAAGARPGGRARRGRALGAPTEVLAEQHYRTFCGLFAG